MELKVYSQNYGLNINGKKTAYMQNTKNLDLDGIEIERVDSFRYLRYTYKLTLQSDKKNYNK